MSFTEMPRSKIPLAKFQQGADRIKNAKQDPQSQENARIEGLKFFAKGHPQVAKFLIKNKPQVVDNKVSDEYHIQRAIEIMKGVEYANLVKLGERDDYLEFFLSSCNIHNELEQKQVKLLCDIAAEYDHGLKPFLANKKDRGGKVA